MVRPGYDVMVAGLQGPGYDVMVAGLQGITNQGCSRPPYNLLCKAPTLTPCHSRVGKWGLETAACITGVGGGLLRAGLIGSSTSQEKQVDGWCRTLAMCSLCAPTAAVALAMG